VSEPHTAPDDFEVDFDAVPDLDELSPEELADVEAAQAALDLEKWEDAIAVRPDVPANDTATLSDPLQGLKHLGPIAVRGASTFRALAAVPIDWVWQDYVVAGTIVTMAGPSAEGKTTLLFLLMLARANTGAPISLGGRQIKPAPPGKYVLVVEAEHGDKSTARKLVKSAGLLGLGDEALGRIVAVSRKAVTLGSPEWKDIERMIAAGFVSDIALDTIARVAPGDGNSEKDQAAHFATIAAAIEKAPADYQPTVWALAHTRKGNADALDDVSGSTQRVGQADTVLMVTAERSDSGQVVASTMRLLKPREEPEAFPEPLVVRVHDGKLEVSSEPAKGKKGKGGKPKASPEQVEKVRQACLAAYEETGDPFLVYARVKELAKELGLGIKLEAFTPAMLALAAQGVLEQRYKEDEQGRQVPNGWSWVG